MEEGDSVIEIQVNGTRRVIGEGRSVLELVEELGLESSRIAIELNLEILPKSLWPATRLVDGSCVEIVHFVGGG